MSNEDGAQRYLRYAQEYPTAPGPTGLRGLSTPGPIIVSSATNQYNIPASGTDTLCSYMFEQDDIGETDLVQLEMLVSPTWDGLTNIRYYWDDVLIATATNLAGSNQTSQVLSLAQVAGQEIHYTLLEENNVASGFVTIHEMMQDGGTIRVRVTNSDPAAAVAGSVRLNVTRIANL